MDRVKTIIHFNTLNHSILVSFNLSSFYYQSSLLNSHGSQFGLVGRFLFGSVLLFLESLLLLEDLLLPELVGGLLSVNNGSEIEHDEDDHNSGGEDNQVVHCRCTGIVDSELEIGPPMERLENVKQEEHTKNHGPVATGVLVDILVIVVRCVKVSGLGLGCGKFNHYVFSSLLLCLNN